MERHIHGILDLRLPMLMIMLLACVATSNAIESDIICLRSIKESLEDPLGTLANWDFNNMSGLFICSFTGVDCWDLGTVISIKLVGRRLRGPFPIGIRNCTNIKILLLSNNSISGPIPSNFGEGLPFMVNLDLSNNNLSGPIPPSIVNCRYISFVRLENNRLTGRMPSDLTGFDRIKVFNVSNNRLSGLVPTFRSSIYISAENYANNPRLCGGPLKACKDDDDLYNFFLSGFVVGFSLFTILSMLCVLLFWVDMPANI